MIPRDDEAGGVARAVARVKDGDHTGLEVLYLRYRDDVRRCVAGIVRNQHDAEDVTQSVFLKLAAAIEDYQPRGVPFSAWLIRVARNAAIDLMRAQRRAMPVENVRAVDEGRQQATLERREALTQALMALPPDQREVIVLRYVAGLSALEIAERLQRSAASVYALQNRGRRSVELALTAVGVMPLAA